MGFSPRAFVPRGASWKAPRPKSEGKSISAEDAASSCRTGDYGIEGSPSLHPGATGAKARGRRHVELRFPMELGKVLPHPLHRRKLARIAEQSRRTDLADAFISPSDWRTNLWLIGSRLGKWLQTLEVCAINGYMEANDEEVAPTSNLLSIASAV